MFQQILTVFMATKPIERNWQFFRCFNRFWPFFWLQNPLTKIDNFSDVSTYFSQFSCDKTHWKMIDSFQMFQQILAIFWQQNPLQKIDSFSDVSPDFGHFSSDKTHWKKLTVFRCFNGFWSFLWRRTPLKKLTAFQMFQQILAIFWRQNPLTRSVPATRILVVKEVFGLFSRLQLWTFFSLR